MMSLLRTGSTCLALAAAALACQPSTSFARTGYPDHPIRLIVPYAVGGGTDVTARILAAGLEPILGEPVIVENRPGAGAQIGTAYVARAPADGYTLLMGSNGMCVDMTLFRKLPYDGRKDFIPVALAGSSPDLLLVNPSLQVRTVSDLVRLAKSEPGRIHFGTPGVGQTPHLEGELLKRMAHIDLTHVPFKGSGESTSNLLAGHVEMSFATLPSTLALVKAGKLRALAVTAPQRSKFLPNVPTMVESGYPGFVAATWTGVFAPAGTPRPVIDKLNAAIEKVLASPRTVALLDKSGLESRPTTPQQFTEYFDSEVAKWAKVIKGAHIPLE